METDGFARREGRIDADFDAYDGVLGVGRKVNVVDVTLAACFEIDGLPYAADVCQIPRTSP